MSLVVNDKGDPSTVSERVIATVLSMEAAAKGLTVDQLKAIRPGRVRRSMHDDMTAMVLWLDTPAGRELYAAKQASAGVAATPQSSSWSFWPFGSKASTAPAEGVGGPAAGSRVTALAEAAAGLPVSLSYVASHPVSSAAEGPGQEEGSGRE